MLFHTQLLSKQPPTGPLLIDGFESFEFSQYFPIQHQLAVEADSGFFRYFTDSELRRKGRMRPDQKIRRQQLEHCYGRSPPTAVLHDVTELLKVALHGTTEALVRSDDHNMYPEALRRVACQIVHEVTPGRQHRDRHNALFEINLLDSWIRHSSANHKRQTLAWSKRRQAAAERLAILMVHRNCMRSRREKQRDGPTPAMLKGLLSRRLDVSDVLEKRLFESRIDLPPRWRQYYQRTIVTRALAVNRRHELKYAY